jgi:hypothetical protein
MRTIASNASIEKSAEIEAVLNYTRNSGARPVNYTFEPPPGVPRNSGAIDAHSVKIRDARIVGGLTLDRNGFEMISHRSALTHWRSFQNPERVKAIYYPEVVAALKAHTGADKVVIFDHTLRDSSVEPGRAQLREAVRRVHDDQTLDSAPRRVAKHLEPDEVARRLERRFAILNFWRPVGHRVQRTPLAMCDARTIESDDLMPSDLVYPDWTGETYSVAFNPRHRWYWYPLQTPWEVTLLKIYDSATDGRARLSAHTAFDLPNSTPDTPPRLSIEVRSIVFW